MGSRTTGDRRRVATIVCAEAGDMRFADMLVAMPVAMTGALAAKDDECWDGGFSRGLCCSGALGPKGNARCWSPPSFTAQRCCRSATSRVSTSVPVRLPGAGQASAAAEPASLVQGALPDMASLAPKKGAATTSLPSGVVVPSATMPPNVTDAAPGWWNMLTVAALPEVRRRLSRIGLDYPHFFVETLSRARSVALCARGATVTVIGGKDTRRHQLCERYTLGDGLCVLEVAGRRSTAALVRSSCNPPLWLCPTQAPVALLLIPKAASTSLANWGGRLDGLQGRWFALRDAVGRDLRAMPFAAGVAVGGATVRGGHLRRTLARRFANESSAMIDALVERALGPRSQAIAAPFRRRSAVFSELRERSGALDLVMPASDCPSCCSHPSLWRTKVVVARHPLARLVSFFRMAWVSNPRRKNSSLWSGFPVWLGHASGLFFDRAIARSWGPEDTYHTRPVTSFLAEAGVDMANVFSLRLERLGTDFRKLKDALCSKHGYCSQLPPLRQRRLEGSARATSGLRQRPRRRWRDAGPSLRELWAVDFVREAMLAGYEADFLAMGYRRDGADL